MRGPTREPMESFDDDRETLCLDREALAVALLPDARRELGPSMMAAAPVRAIVQRPVPHFRPAQWQRQEPTVVVPARGLRRPPLGAWLVAAALAGAVSFLLAPIARDNVGAVLHALTAAR